MASDVITSPTGVKAMTWRSGRVSLNATVGVTNAESGGGTIH
jgi:hypothetical protein